MKEQMSENKNAAWTIAFLGMILLFLTAADLLTPERTYSENENRILAKKPELTVEGVRDGSFMKDFGEYVRDQFVGRDKWVMLKTQGDILLQKKEINGVYLCKDDYLIEQHLPQDIDENTVKKKINLLKRLNTEYGAKAMLVPTADNILTEKLPAYVQYYDETKLLAQVKESLGEKNVIDVTDALKEHEDEEIYYRTDHHWTSLGAYYGYQAWKEQTGKLAPVLLEPEQLTKVSDSFLGTLYSKLNVPWKADAIECFPEELLRTVSVTYDFNRRTDSLYESGYLEEKNKYGYFLDDNHPFIEIETGYQNGRSLFLIKDSYANCMIPMLSLHYEKIYVVDLRYYNGRLVNLMDGYVTEATDVLVLYDCIHFIENFVYY